LLAWYQLRGEVLTTSFEAILADPLNEAERLSEFLLIDASAAASVVMARPSTCAPDLSFEMQAAS